jgi:hypothetical protein
MSHTFRPTRKSWLRSLGSLLVLAVLLMLAWVIFPAPMLLLVIIVLFGLLAGPELYRFTRTWLMLDENGLRGQVGRRRYDLHWSGVRLARLEHIQSFGDYLVLVSQSEVYPIPLKGLEAEAIWQAAQTYLPPEAINAEASQKLAESQTQAWSAQVAALELPITLPTNPWLVLFLGGSLLLYLWAIFNGAGSIGRDLTTQLCLGGMALFSLGMLLATLQRVHIDDRGLHKRTLLGYYFLGWDEIDLLRIDPTGAMLVFQGIEKRLVLVIPFLAGGRKADALGYISYQLHQRGIETRSETRLAFTPVFSSRSARVQRE